MIYDIFFLILFSLLFIPVILGGFACSLFIIHVIEQIFKEFKKEK